MTGFFTKLRPLIPRNLKAILGPLFRPRIASTARLDDRKLISLGSDTFIDHYCILRPDHGQITLGNNSYLGPFSVILGSGGVSIGNDVMVGPHTVFASGNHDFTRVDRPMWQFAMQSDGPIVIENDVWIGAHCLICDNVTIATGSVIGGGAVVTKSTEPFGIYAGVPAKKIGSRISKL
jgi:acetyltransferase-like isoleucine patch superfamily enzyme